MGIDKQSDIAANLQIGPTTLGMVRIFVEGEGFELPLDFEPDEALEIAEEIRLAAERARAMASSSGGKGKGAETVRGGKSGQTNPPQAPRTRPGRPRER